MNNLFKVLDLIRDVYEELINQENLNRHRLSIKGHKDIKIS